jgi:uncharacterized protein (DUF427 family)
MYYSSSVNISSKLFLSGTASYFTISVDGKQNPDACWYYPTPKPAAAEIKDRVAFWKGVKVT